MRVRDFKLRNLLAGEYVLGTQSARVRRRFEAMMARDPALRTLADRWRERLHPLDLKLAEVEPPARLRHRIESQLPVGARQGTTAREGGWRGWWNSVSVWRFAALAASVAALGLALRIALPPGVAPQPEYVAVLVDEKQVPTMLLRASADQRAINVTVLGAPALGAEQSFELWALPPGGAPRSLGLLPRSGQASVALRATVARTLELVPAVAVSVEPKGGSPTGAPTGPVVFQGKLTRVGT